MENVWKDSEVFDDTISNIDCLITKLNCMKRMNNRNKHRKAEEKKSNEKLKSTRGISNEKNVER